MSDNEVVHGEHRARIRKKFQEHGFEGWYEHEILEMMLFYAVPRADTNPLAHTLLNEFGTLSQVLDADVTTLKKVDGVGENIAVYLNALGKLQSAYTVSKWHNNKQPLVNSTAAGLFCVDFIGNETDEVMAVICLDAQRFIKKKTIISRGVVDAVSVSIRKIAEIAIGINSKFIVICHNHPSGVPHPSYQDIELTKSIVTALTPLNIDLIDHIVVGGKTFTSMADRGYIQN